jgi:hypothetical protein
MKGQLHALTALLMDSVRLWNWLNKQVGKFQSWFGFFKEQTNLFSLLEVHTTVYSLY